MKILFCVLFSATASFFSLTIPTIDGSSLPLSNHQGKKILVVNIATRGKYVHQMSELQQLYQQHHSNLLVIAVPSGSFGSLPHNSQQLRQLLTDSFSISFPVAQIGAVTGNGKHPIYDWLGDSTKNGKINLRITRDFQKVMISETGTVIGFYNDMVSPLDPKIVQAITRNVN